MPAFSWIRSDNFVSDGLHINCHSVCLVNVSNVINKHVKHE